MFENILTNPTVANDFTTYVFGLVVAPYHYTKQRWFLFFFSEGSKKKKQEIFFEPFTSSKIPLYLLQTYNWPKC